MIRRVALLVAAGLVAGQAPSRVGPPGEMGRLGPDALLALPLSPGSSSPLFIRNNFNPAGKVPGSNAGFRVWIGANPTATPGPPDTVGGTMYIDSTGGRSNVWNLDLIAASSTTAEGGRDGTATNIEAEMQSNRCFNPAPFGSANNCYSRTTGIGLTARGGGLYPNTVGLSVYSALGAGADWWNTGIAMTRVLSTGLSFVKDPTPGESDAAAFTTAAIHDQSDSARVLKIDGSHKVGIDLSDAQFVGILIQGLKGADTNAGLRNAVDHAATWSIDSGLQGPQPSALALSDRGNAKWAFIKDASGALQIYDVVNGANRISIAPGGVVTLSGAVVLPSGTPASSSAPCVRGQRMADAAYDYVCTEPNTWKRTALSGF